MAVGLRAPTQNQALRHQKAFFFHNLENQSLRSRSPSYQGGVGGSVKNPISQMGVGLS